MERTLPIGEAVTDWWEDTGTNIPICTVEEEYQGCIRLNLARLKRKTEEPCTVAAATDG